MSKTPKSLRVGRDALIAAGLDLMRQNGKPLTVRPSHHRSRMYQMPDGQTVRVRTCNHHILVVAATTPSPDAKLNIEGTDFVLHVMPEVENMAGKVLAYLIPAKEVEEVARKTHQQWLDSGAESKGNKTWNIWFNNKGFEPSSNFHTKWAKYRLPGDATTIDFADEDIESVAPQGLTVDQARSEMAIYYGIPESQIDINFRW